MSKPAGGLVATNSLVGDPTSSTAAKLATDRDDVKAAGQRVLDDVLAELAGRPDDARAHGSPL